MNDRPKYLCLIKGGQIVVNSNGNVLVLEDKGNRAHRREQLMDAYQIDEFPHDYLLRGYNSIDEIPKPDEGEVVDLEGTVDFGD
jgi:hypothetical protein